MILILGILAFTFYEFYHISHPYYWDEAWSYAKAIYAMHEKGPSMMPGAIDADLYRGHPLFFYFITTVWMSVFGSSVTAVHTFFLLVTLVLIVLTYRAGTNIWNRNTGLFAALSLMLTPVILSQATFLLPEVLLALLTLFTLYFYIEKKLLWEIVFGTMLLLTKETGIVLIGTILLYDFLVRVIDVVKKRQKFTHLLPLAMHAIPIVFALLFFVVQKIKLGWFLFPEHVELVNLNIKAGLNNAVNIARYVMQLQGRIILTLVGLVAIAVFLYRKKKMSRKEKQIFIVGGLFLFFYVVFSAFNFYTHRYTISILPVFFLLAFALVGKLFSNRILLVGAVAGVFGALTLFTTIKPTEIGDDTVGYLSMVKVYEKTFDYLDKQNYNDETIAAHFLTYHYMLYPYIGYRQNRKLFTKVTGLKTPVLSDIVILSADGPPDYNEYMRTSDEFELKTRLEHGAAWCEVYKRRKVDDKLVK